MACKRRCSEISNENECSTPSKRKYSQAKSQTITESAVKKTRETLATISLNKNNEPSWKRAISDVYEEIVRKDLF